MIGSHDSYTYLSSVNGYNKFAKYWRCQTKSIQEQLDCGVRFFDIRVKEETKKNKIVWRTCHGAAELDKVFSSLTSMCTYFKNINAKIRIVLESGDDKFFRSEINKVLPTFRDIITQVVIKKDWVVLYEDWKGISIKWYTFQMWNSDWSLFKNIKNFLSNTIKSWAAEHSPAITKEMIDDDTTLYFMDYV